MEKATIAKSKDGQLYLKNFYTPLSIAKKEIWRRWNDEKLKKKVEKFLGKGIPKVFKGEPKAVLSRYIVSPNYDFFRFLELSELSELKPVFLEYVEDLFVAGNTDKYHLCKLFLYDGEGKNGGSKINTSKIIDFPVSEGKPLNNLCTSWGEKLVGFHHKLVKDTAPEVTIKRFDMKNWYSKKGRVPEKYYYYSLALYICHGILFENFLLNEEEKNFTEYTVLKNFNKLINIFDVNPIIVPITPLKYESDLYWWCYPKSIEKNVPSL